MLFELLTLTGAKFRGEVTEVTLTTANGQIGVLPNHEPLTAVVKPGSVVVREKGGKQTIFATFGGLLEVTPDATRVLADEAEHEDSLVQGEIQIALAEAEALKAKAGDKHELARAQELVDRQTVRLGVAQMRRRTHRPDRQTPPE